MLKAGAALYQPLHHIIFEREAILSHTIDDELFEAVVLEVLTRHEVKELIGNRRLAVQFFDFKALKR